MKYKKGDKVVVEVDGIRQQCFNPLYLTKSNTLSRMFLNDDNILGKLEDFTPAEKKIKMTAEEKREFDELKRIREALFLAFSDIYDGEYPNLFDLLFDDDDAEENNKAQLEFSRAWNKPSRIEVEKEKKYYVHLFKSQKFGYINQNRDSLQLITSAHSETNEYKTQFTKDEIEKLDLGFKINDDALEKVEDD